MGEKYAGLGGRSYSITALYVGCVAYIVTITFAVLLVLGAIYFLF